jgi:UDP-glucose 4-epimerase
VANILLTGASGWLGRFLAPMLRARNHSVIGLDVAPSPDTQIIGSVADKAVIDDAIRTHHVTAIVHAGGLHKPDIARYPAQAFIDVNVTGTLNLLEAARAHGVDRFVFTSTTSLMISQAIRNEESAEAVWLNETSGPLEPRNIYGVTKLAGEGLCRQFSLAHGLPCIVLRTSRFFPEEDDTHRALSGENMKANELLYRRLTVEDAALAHIAALEHAPKVGFDILLVSAPTPFHRGDARALKQDARDVILRHFPQAAELYGRQGWQLPASIGRVYDASRAEQVIGFRAATDFAAVLDALRQGTDLPFAHDPGYVSPVVANSAAVT